MEQIAFIYGSTYVYWSRILLALAAATAICLYLSLYPEKPGTFVAAVVSVPLGMAVSMVLARLLHWYCRPDQYGDLTAALTNYRAGGYALAGVFAGCLLTACLLRAVRLSKNLPHMLDCMAIAGCGGIAVGRLSCFFNTADRGMVLASARGLPWAWPMIHPVSGAQELRLATFFLQALAAAALFLALLGFRLAGKQRKTLRHGDICLVFLLCYGASQVLLDSTRYDSLYFRSNGFVSIVQVLGACGMGLAAILFSVRMVRACGWKKWYSLLWLWLAGLLGTAGYMEYFVQRHSHKAVLGYNSMALALLGSIAVVLVIRILAVSEERKREVRTGWEQ